MAYIVTECRSKKILYSISALVAIYYSAFRNGLGTDYKGYLSQFKTLELDFSVSNEPLYTLLKDLILHTNLSIVFFFCVCSVFTVWFIWKYLDDKQNEFASLSIIIFLSIPGLYFNTFNIVRQYFSTAIFLYSLTYIRSKNIFRYTFCIAVAFTMHVSSILLFPLYFVLNKKFPIIVYLIFAVILFSIAYSLEPFLQAISVLSDRYSVYLDEGGEAGNSTLTFLCIAILILYFLKSKLSGHNRKYDESPYIVMSSNMYILFIVFSLLSTIDIHFSRFAVYFGASICVMIPYVLNLFFRNYKSVAIICLLVSFAYFFSFISFGRDNPEICSDKLLPITSIFDISPI